MPDNNGVKVKEASGSDPGDGEGDVIVVERDGGKSGDGSTKTPRRERSEDSLSHDSIIGETSVAAQPLPPPLIVTATEDDGDTSPAIRVIPPAALALGVEVAAGPSATRKSPVTVQEWVDSLPPPRLREDNTPEQWPAPRPDGLTREASVQSDAGSHCSSVESLLGSRRPDPEEILLGLGFGGAHNDLDSDVARIPRRFLRPSKVKGVAIDDFLKHQHDLVQTFESGFFGYRGLTGPGYRTPSVIVAKIMEKLRVGKSSPTPTTSTPTKRFSRAARKLINVLPSSVLTPDNRMFLDSQGGKSPEVPRKRMIIGKRSFTFDTDGHIIEQRTSPSDSMLESASEMSTCADEAAPAPALSTSSRSASLDSSEAPTLPQLTWELPRQIWDTTAKTDVPRSFTRYESIEETSERGSESTDEPAMSALQQRRGSLKRQQHVDEDKSDVDPGLHTLAEVDVSTSDSPTRSNMFSSFESFSINDEAISTDSSRMEDLLNPDGQVESGISEANDDIKLASDDNDEEKSVEIVKEENNISLKVDVREKVDENKVEKVEVKKEEKLEILEIVKEENNVSFKVDVREKVDENKVENVEVKKEEILAVKKVEKAEVKKEEKVEVKKEEKVPQRREVVEPLCTQQIRGPMAPLLRVRSDSSGFLDQDVADLSSLEERRELDDLLQELKRRGLPAPASRDCAVRLALESYSSHLGAPGGACTDLAEARCDVEALRRLRELVAVELRRVADLLDERPVAAGLPVVTEQMTALLRQQTRLRRQLESLSEVSPSRSPRVADPLPCCEVLSYVQDGHRHLQCLIEKNSHELADIRKLLSELIDARR